MFEQKKRYTDKEVSLITHAFRDQENLLILLRKFLLQGQMTVDELKYLKASVNGDILEVVVKTISPELDKGAVINGTVDLFSNIDVTATPIDHAVLQIEARKLAYTYLKQRFEVLRGKKVENEISFDGMLDGKDDRECYIGLVARNFLLTHIDRNGLLQLLILAEPEDTPDVKLQKAKLNSNK